MGVGVAVGLSIPSTDSEDQLVGQCRDRFLAKAKEKATDLADIAKETVRTVAASGARSAKKQLSEAGGSIESPAQWLYTTLGGDRLPRPAALRLSTFGLPRN